jgi:nitrite reductase (NADH) large subunit
VLFGDTADGLWYLNLIRTGELIESFRDDLAFGRALVERLHKPAFVKLAA